MDYSKLPRSGGLKPPTPSPCMVHVIRMNFPFFLTIGLLRVSSGCYKDKCVSEAVRIW